MFRHGVGGKPCEAQADICRDAATSRGWKVARVFADEAGPSETLDRPAMQKLLDEIKAGKVKRLIVDRLDRLTRRLVDLLMLLELFDDHQVQLAVVNDPNFSTSATSRFMTHIVAAASGFQLETSRERLADARAALKRKGKRVAGRVPFSLTTGSSVSQTKTSRASSPFFDAGDSPREPAH